jgi:hypothetical protein
VSDRHAVSAEANGARLRGRAQLVGPVTLDRYGHLFPELDEAIAVAFDQRWTEARAAAGVA